MRTSAPKTEGIGLKFPEREADCSGVRPSWYPFQIQVDACDDDDPDVDPFPTERHRTLPDAAPIPWSPA